MNAKIALANIQLKEYTLSRMTLCRWQGNNLYYINVYVKRLEIHEICNFQLSKFLFQLTYSFELM